jgi:hypothetical protein
LLGAIFHRQPFTPPEIEAYAMGLADVSPKNLYIVTEHLLKKHLEFMPSPAQIREAMQIALENRAREPAPECNECGGTGFKIIVADQLNPEKGNYAKKCDCRKV